MAVSEGFMSQQTGSYRRPPRGLAPVKRTSAKYRVRHAGLMVDLKASTPDAALRLAWQWYGWPVGESRAVRI